MHRHVWLHASPEDLIDSCQFSHVNMSDERVTAAVAPGCYAMRLLAVRHGRVHRHASSLPAKRYHGSINTRPAGLTTVTAATARKTPCNSSLLTIVSSSPTIHVSRGLRAVSASDATPCHAVSRCRCPRYGRRVSRR